MASHFWWYVARASGLVAWGLVVASCAWGLLHALRTFGRRLRDRTDSRLRARTGPWSSPAWMLSTHRYLSALAIAFVAVHVVAVIADDFVHFGLVDVLVPMASSWHPLAVAWGIVAMYVLLVVEGTSLARAHLSPKVWRGIHMLSYVLLGMVTIHLLTAGTDANDLLPTASAVLIGVAAVFGCAMLLTWRTAPKIRPVAAGSDVVTGR